MAGKVLLKKSNVESAFRLYCYLMKKELISEKVLVLSLIEAYEGLMFNEIVEISGIHPKAVNATLQIAFSKNMVYKEDLIPGREWLVEQGSRGTYQVTKDLRREALKFFGAKDIPSATLKSFSTMLFNMKEHGNMIKPFLKVNTTDRPHLLISTALSALARSVGLILESSRVPTSHWTELTMLGYVKQRGEILNKRAYLHDKRGVKIKCD